MKRIATMALALFLCTVMVFMVLPTEVNAAELASGQCGDYAYWSLTTDGKLTITGTGDVGGWPYYTPWNTSEHDYRSAIRTVVIGEGITELNASFSQCEGLTSVSLPSTLTSLPSSAFYNCAKLTSVTIPYGVTSIPYGAFESCVSLETVVLPATITYIGDYAFQDCSSLKSITIPASVTEIDYYAFDGCISLTSISLPDSIETLGTSIFRNCTSLKSAKLPNGLLEIPSSCFSGCTSLASITIPDSVYKINSSAFRYCDALTSVTIPDAVASIGSYAFAGCDNLQSAKLPAQLAKVESGLFSECPALKSIVIPTGVATIEGSAFSNCSSLASVTIPNTVTSIGSYAFYNCDSIMSITIPNSVVTIGYEAFDDCDGIKSITIPNSVTSIGNYAFGWCGKLDTVIFAGDAPTIESSAFYGCVTRFYYPKGNSTYANYLNSDLGASACAWLEEGKELNGQVGSSKYLTWTLSRDNKLTITATRKAAMPDFETYGDSNRSPWQSIRKLIHSVEISENVTRVGNNAFSDCYNLTSVTLPSTLKTIGGSAFYNCALTSVTLPSKLTSIGGSAFSSCDNLTSISIPKSVTSIGSSAFSNTGLKKISVPSSVTSLGWSAFSGCGQLTTATIPGSVGYLDDSMFEGCVKLTKVTLGEGIRSIDYDAFYGCTSLASITLPESVTSIGSSAFQDCVNLSSITLPRNVSSLGSSAFKNCVSLISINLPARIRYINNHTFYECSALETVTFTGDAPTSIDAEAFLNVYATVYYPKGNSTWTSSVRKDYGGDLTWKSKSGITKLEITQQPTSVKVREGKTAKVTVKATGDGLKYAWYYYVDGEGWKLTTSFTDNYYQVKMNPARDGRTVYCVITDKFGNAAVTDTVWLTMSDETEITQQPKGVAVAKGKTAKVTVKAEGEGLKYTWYTKDVGKTKFTKSSVTKSTYSVKMTDARSGRQLYCVITDSKGNELRTNTVTISQITITKQPKNATGATNKTVKATVKASGDGLKYQWYVKDVGKTKFSKSSTTKSTYSYTMTAAKSGRQAYCVITDIYGNSVTTKTVTFSRLYIKTQPSSVTVASGKPAKVTVKAVGDTLTYTWYVKNPGESSFTKSSVTKSSYSVTMNRSRNGRQVYCVITDIYGNTVKTNTVTLKMK